MFSSVYGVTHNNCRRSVLFAATDQPLSAFAATDQPILSCVVSLHGLDERGYGWLRLFNSYILCVGNETEYTYSFILLSYAETA